MMRALKYWFLVAAVGALIVVGSAMDGPPGAAAQTVEGRLSVVKHLPIRDADALAWSPDGRLLAVAIIGGGYEIWDVQSARKVRELGGKYGKGPTESLAFAPDGKHLIVELHDYVQTDPNLFSFALWNVETGAVDLSVKGPSQILSYAVSAATERIAVLYVYKQVVLYDTRTWMQVRTWAADPHAVVIAIEPSGHLVALGGGISPNEYRGEPMGQIFTYEAETGRPIATINGAQQGAVSQLVFLGTSGRIASTADQLARWRNYAANQLEDVRDVDPIRIWDAYRGRKVSSYELDFGSPRSLVSTSAGEFLGLGALARGLGDASHYWVWNTASGNEVGRLSSGATYFDVSAFSADGRYVAVNNVPLRRTGFEVLIIEVGSPR